MTFAEWVETLEAGMNADELAQLEAAREAMRRKLDEESRGD